MPEKPKSVFSYLNEERVADRAVVVSAEDPFGALCYEVCDVNDERGREVLSDIKRYYDAEDLIFIGSSYALRYSLRNTQLNCNQMLSPENCNSLFLNNQLPNDYAKEF